MGQNIPTIQFGNFEFTYSIIRTNRKSIGIVVQPDGNVEVRSPLKMDEEEINRIVFNKRKWITEKLKKISEIKHPVPAEREFISGEKIKIKDKIYRLKIHSHSKKRPRITFVTRIAHIYVNENLDSDQKETEIKRVLIKWYKKYSYNFITYRIHKFTKFLDINLNEIFIRDLKKRWGSCTKNNNLVFNWRIIMAPISIIDYVLLHEVCHLVEDLHSPKFWDLLKSIMPDYKKRKEWLRINGPTLEL